MAWYVLLLTLVVAWARIEWRHRQTSDGVGSTVGGGLLAYVGFFDIAPYLDLALGVAAGVVGLAFFAFGLSRVVTREGDS